MLALVAAGAGGYGLPKSTSVSVSVAALLPRLVSVIPVGAATVTVVASVPVVIPTTSLAVRQAQAAPEPAASVIASRRGAAEGRVQQRVGDRVDQVETADRVRPVVGDRDRVGIDSARSEGGRGVGDGDRQVGWPRQRVVIGGGV